jgi:hypothetical protein
MQVVWPDEPWPPREYGRPAEIAQVDISPQRSTFSATLPARDHLQFLAEISLEWRVVDPAAVVRRKITNARGIVLREVEQRARSIAAGFGIEEISAAEDAINRDLRGVGWPGWRRQGEPPLTDGDYIGAEYGLWTRALVQLIVPGIPAERSEAETGELGVSWLPEQRYYARNPGPEEAADLLAYMQSKEPSTPEQMAGWVFSLIHDSDLSDETKKALERYLQAPREKGSSDRRAGEAAQPPAPPPVTYDDVVRRAFAELVEPGRLLFNPPDRMQLGKTARVEVRLTRTLLLDTELVKGLRGLGATHIEEISTSPKMAVTLQSEGFKITPYSEEEQRVAPDQITTWEFDIKALKRGQQHLVISVSLRIPIPDQPTEHKSVPVREATIEVQVGAAAVVQFVTANWQWFVGTAIAIGGLVATIIVH